MGISGIIVGKFGLRIESSYCSHEDSLENVNKVYCVKTPERNVLFFMLPVKSLIHKKDIHRAQIS